MLLAAPALREDNRHGREVLADAIVELTDMIRDAAEDGKRGVRITVNSWDPPVQDPVADAAEDEAFRVAKERMDAAEAREDAADAATRDGKPR